jgi:hypothetical protein
LRLTTHPNSTSSWQGHGLSYIARESAVKEGRESAFFHVI